MTLAAVAEISTLGVSGGFAPRTTRTSRGRRRGRRTARCVRCFDGEEDAALEFVGRVENGSTATVAVASQRSASGSTKRVSLRSKVVDGWRC